MITYKVTIITRAGKTFQHVVTTMSAYDARVQAMQAAADEGHVVYDAEITTEELETLEE